MEDHTEKAKAFFEERNIDIDMELVEECFPPVVAAQIKNALPQQSEQVVLAQQSQIPLDFVDISLDQVDLSGPLLDSSCAVTQQDSLLTSSEYITLALLGQQQLIPGCTLDFKTLHQHIVYLAIFKPDVYETLKQTLVPPLPIGEVCAAYNDNEPTVSFDNVSTVSIDEVSTVSIGNEPTVSIDNEPTVSIGNASTVSIGTVPTVSINSMPTDYITRILDNDNSKKKREMNRLAAQRSRGRKIEKVKNLEERIAELTIRKNSLLEIEAFLQKRNEILDAKNSVKEEKVKELEKVLTDLYRKIAEATVKQHGTAEN